MKQTSAERVEAVYTLYPQSRTDNRVLVLRQWDAEGLNLTPEQWAKVPYLTQPETIRRTGCKLRNDCGRFDGNDNDDND
jgi:hypothetical protein